MNPLAVTLETLVAAWLTLADSIDGADWRVARVSDATAYRECADQLAAALAEQQARLDSFKGRAQLHPATIEDGEDAEVPGSSPGLASTTACQECCGPITETGAAACSRHPLLVDTVQHPCVACTLEAIMQALADPGRPPQEEKVR